MEALDGFLEIGEKDVTIARRDDDEFAKAGTALDSQEPMAGLKGVIPIFGGATGAAFGNALDVGQRDFSQRQAKEQDIQMLAADAVLNLRHHPEDENNESEHTAYAEQNEFHRELNLTGPATAARQATERPG